MLLSAGTPEKLGAHRDGGGTNFAIFSANAEKIELCLFDESGTRESARMALPERSGDIWHGYVKDLGPGQLYGYRVHGPYAPEKGHRFNPNKLLLDPYARTLSGALTLSDLHFGYRRDDPRADLSFDNRDNAAAMVKGVVTADFAADKVSKPLSIPWADTIIYEAHVKGLTQLRGDVPAGWRGTFRALGSPAIVDHLKRLGVTALELLPIHAFIDDWFVTQRGLRNYWGYSTLGFFAPETRYAGRDPRGEFRDTVARLHDAGIEVILDVVYNHSCESDELGPTLSFRGLDNASYYRLVAERPRFYDNATGCGNTLNLAHPYVRQMAIDSLKYWVDAFGIDGFRFDLAVSLARGANGFESDSPFFAAIREVPALAGVKLIAEPWDLGPGGYRAGGFPAEWSEWNDKFRRTIRRYWNRGGVGLGEIAQRVTASADLFDHAGRLPRASINYVTVHDGFTLADLVSFEAKHNEENREDNRDGENDNDSTNCGAEGPTEDKAVIAMRRQLRRNLIVTLLLAQGTPLLLAGDEVGNSQSGNNNAYSQDNHIGWVKWTGQGHDGEDLIPLIAQLTALRRRFLPLRARHWLEGRRADGSHDITWLTPQGREMVAEDWDFPDGRFLSYLLAGEKDGDSPLFIVFNATMEDIPFVLPPARGFSRWKPEIDTATDASPETVFNAASPHIAPQRSVLVFSAIA